MCLQTHEVDAGCCACLGKVFCSVVLALCLLLVAALSAVAVATGRFQFWTYLQGTDMSPTYVLRCSLLSFQSKQLFHDASLLLSVTSAWHAVTTHLSTLGGPTGWGMC